MQEALFLFVLVLAVASGWLLGQRQASRYSLNATKKIPEAYFRGLSHLLNEQPEQAWHCLGCQRWGAIKPSHMIE